MYTFFTKCKLLPVQGLKIFYGAFPLIMPSRLKTLLDTLFINKGDHWPPLILFLKKTLFLRNLIHLSSIGYGVQRSICSLDNIAKAFAFICQQPFFAGNSFVPDHQAGNVVAV
jgi:hypothetical protein